MQKDEAWLSQTRLRSYMNGMKILPLQAAKEDSLSVFGSSEKRQKQKF